MRTPHILTSLSRDLRRNWKLYSLALPGIIWLVIFAYVPMSGHVIAFKNYRAPRGVFGSEWLPGDNFFKNFDFFFSSGAWLEVTRNTLLLNFLYMAAELSIALLIAIFLNEVRVFIFKRVSQSLVLLPYFISWLAVSVMFFTLFNGSNGLINNVLAAIGTEGPRWYSRPDLWPALLTGVHVWKQAGYTSIIFLAAITSIPRDYYECAMIDGAGKFQQMFHITLPLLRPTVVILALLALGRMFYGNFEMIYSLVGENGVLFPTTNIIDTYTYRALRNLGNFGMTAAVGLYQAVLGLITILFFNWLVKRIDRDEPGLF
jgi:putative aldouronate transport system permease protein